MTSWIPGSTWIHTIASVVVLTGTPSTDVTNINAALAGGNKNIYVTGDAGTYELDGVLEFESNTRLVFAPGLVFERETDYDGYAIRPKTWGTARTTDVFIQGFVYDGHQDFGDYPGSGQAVTSWSGFACNFWMVDRITINDCHFGNNHKYCINFANATQFEVKNCTFGRYFTQISDGIHIQGPSSHFYIHNNAFKTNDDSLAITCSDYSAHLTDEGDVYFGRFVNNKVEAGSSSAQNGVKILAGTDSGSTELIVDDIVIDGLYGSVRNAGVTCYEDPNDTATTGGTIKRVVARNINVTSVQNAGVILIAHSDVEDVLLENVSLNETDNRLVNFIKPTGLTTHVKHLTIRNCDFTNQNYWNGIVYLGGSCGFDEINVDSCRWSGYTSTKPHAFYFDSDNSGGGIIRIINSHIQNVNSFLRCPQPAIPDFYISNSYISAGRLCEYYSGSSKTINIFIDNSELVFSLQPFRSTGGSTSITAFLNGSIGSFTTSSGSWELEDGGSSFNVRSKTFAFIDKSTTPTLASGAGDKLTDSAGTPKWHNGTSWASV